MELLTELHDSDHATLAQNSENMSNMIFPPIDQMLLHTNIWNRYTRTELEQAIYTSKRTQ